MQDDDFKRVDPPNRTIALLKQAIPNGLSRTVYQATAFINIVFIGKLNDNKMLAGVGMGNMIISIMAYSIISGVNGALDTLIPQAFGLKDLKLCGVYLNRGRFIISVYLLLIALPIWYIEPVLLKLGQDPEVSYYAALYAKYVLPSQVILCFDDAQRRFLNAIGRNQYVFYSQVLAQIVHFILVYTLVYQRDMEVLGIGIAMFASAAINFACNFIYSSFFIPEIREAIFLPDASAFQNLGTQLSLGMSYMLMIVIEWWAFELITLICGLLGPNEVAAQVIFMNIQLIVYVFGLGIGSAACFFIGKAIGEQDEPEAKLYYRAGLKIMLGFVVLTNVPLYVFGEYILKFYTTHEEILEVAQGVLWLVVLSNFPDQLFSYFKGPVSALGIQKKVVGFNFLLYFVFLMPVILVLGFYLELGYSGIWMGVVLAQTFGATYMFSLLSMQDWGEAMEAAKKRKEQEDI